MRNVNLKFKIVMLVFLVFIFAGCSGKELRLYINGMPPNMAATKLIAKYEKQNPGIKIVVNKKVAADVIVAEVGATPALVSDKAVQALDDYLKRAKTGEKDFMAPFFSGVKYNEKVYALPWYGDVGVLYYRKDLVPYPPKTWTELVYLSQNYREEGMWGLVFAGKKGLDLVSTVLELFWSNGGSVFTAEGEAIFLASENNTTALNYLVNTIYWHHIAPAEVLRYSAERARQDFLNGKALFMRGWASDRQGMDERQVGISLLPKGPEGRGGVACLAGKNLYISKKAKHKGEAFDFINWLTSQKIQKQYALTAGALPTRRAVFNDVEVLTKKPYFMDILPIFYQARIKPALITGKSGLAILQDSFYAALQQKKSVKQLLKAATAKLKKL